MSRRQYRNYDDPDRVDLGLSCRAKLAHTVNKLLGEETGGFHPGVIHDVAPLCDRLIENGEYDPDASDTDYEDAVRQAEEEGLIYVPELEGEEPHYARRRRRRRSPSRRRSSSSRSTSPRRRVTFGESTYYSPPASYRSPSPSPSASIAPPSGRGPSRSRGSALLGSGRSVSSSREYEPSGQIGGQEYLGNPIRYSNV